MNASQYHCDYTAPDFDHHATSSMGPCGFRTFVFYGCGDHRDLHSFPTRRSSDLVFPKIAGMMDKFAVIRSVVGCSGAHDGFQRSEEHTSELQSQANLVCRLLLEKKKLNKASLQDLQSK